MVRKPVGMAGPSPPRVGAPRLPGCRAVCARRAGVGAHVAGACKRGVEAVPVGRGARVHVHARDSSRTSGLEAI